MVKEASLNELTEIEGILKNQLKYEIKYLGDFDNYHIKNGEIYFHIRKYFSNSLGIPFDSVTLDEYRDKKTNETLPSEYKLVIKSRVKTVEKLKKRLMEIWVMKRNKVLGKDFFNADIKKIKSNTDKNKYDNQELVQKYFDVAIKINNIPKPSVHLTKYASLSKWSRLLSNKNDIINLAQLVQKRIDSKKHKHKTDEIQILSLLKDNCFLLINKIESKTKEQNTSKIKYVEYNGDILTSSD